MSLAGKTAIVTGAARGIGKAIAVALAGEGANVVVAARSVEPGPLPGTIQETAQLITESGGSAMAIPCDVTNEASVKGLVEPTLVAYGRIDILVNNAAMMERMPFEEMTVEHWDQAVATNLRGPFLLSRECVPLMVKQGGGNILNIASDASHRTNYDYLDKGSRGWITYGTTKAALERFTVMLALELKPHNIAVNAIRPGRIVTEKTLKEAPDMDPSLRSLVEVIIPAVLFLVSQTAATFTARVVSREEFGKTWP